MIKGVQAEDVLQSIRAGQGEAAARAFVEQLKSKGGVSVTLAEVPQGRKRKHRFGNIEGDTLGIRMPVELKVEISRRAALANLKPTVYARRLLESALAADVSGARKSTLAVVASPFQHGTVSGYRSHGCRCDLCRKAQSEYMKAYHHNRKARAAQS
jgi:hypothetical protein